MNNRRILGTTVAIAAVMAIGVLAVIGVAIWQLREYLGAPATPSYQASELYSKAERLITSNGDYQQAETYLEQALRQQNDTTYRNQLAVVKYRLKKYSESIDQYQQFLEGGGDVAFGQNGIGNAYRDWALQTESKRAEYNQLALKAYDAAIAADANYAAAYANQAQLLIDMGKSEQAQQVLATGIAATQSKELEQLRQNLFDK